MSTKRGNRPTDIGAMLSLGNLDAAVTARATPSAESRPRTAAGELLAERRSGLETENARLRAQVGDLQAEVQKWSDSLPVVALDPDLVEHSRFANRIAESFDTPEFREFKAEISAAGGNVQPIKVVPIPGTDPQRYSIVYGHRRHRACLELGIKVNAIVENLSERGQFIEMERENRGRRDLSAYEQGLWYLRACSPVIPAEKGTQPGWALFGNMSEMAEALGVDKGNVSKACQIAELPDAVLAAFGRPTEIQFNWATALTRARKQDLTGLLGRAAEVRRRREAGELLSAKTVYSLLTAPAQVAVEQGAELELTRADGTRFARLLRDKKGRTVVEFDAPLSSAATDKLVEGLVKLFQ